MDETHSGEIEKAAQYRERAAAARHYAATMRDPDARAAMLAAAELWDQMAAKVELHADSLDQA